MDFSIPIQKWYFWTPSQGELSKTPKPTFLPAMQARRLSSVDKLALFGLEQLDTQLNTIKTVFASQHGELERTCKILQQMALESDISPTLFSTSVHNTASGLFSIAVENKLASTAIAAGENTLSAALLEAYSLLQEGDEDVGLVIADYPPNEPLDSFEELKHSPFVISLLLSKQNPSISLTLTPNKEKQNKRLDHQAAELEALLSHKENELTLAGWSISIA